MSWIFRFSVFIYVMLQLSSVFSADRDIESRIHKQLSSIVDDVVKEEVSRRWQRLVRKMTPPAWGLYIDSDRGIKEVVVCDGLNAAAIEGLASAVKENSDLYGEGGDYSAEEEANRLNARALR